MRGSTDNTESLWELDPALLDATLHSRGYTDSDIGKLARMTNHFNSTKETFNASLEQVTREHNEHINEVQPMTIKPISPKLVAKMKEEVIPEKVIEIFNRHIARDYSNNRAIVYQGPIVAAIMTAIDCDRDHVYDSGWLNIEEMYREQGWSVTYSKPGYDESGDAYWEFVGR